MTDLTTLRTTHEAGLTRRERWEVVVVHVPLGLVRIDGVEHLLHLQHAERRRVQDLRFTTCEQRGAMGFLQHINLDRDLANIGQASAVHPDTLSNNTRTHDVLLNLAEGAFRFTDLVFFEIEAFKNLVANSRLLVLTLVLISNNAHSFELRLSRSFNLGKHFRRVLDKNRPLDLFGCRHLSLQFELEVDQLTDDLLGDFEPFGDRLLVGWHLASLEVAIAVLGCAGFDHGNVDIA
ncbi:hypothetical protein BMS3Bbin02_01358 [bacterium BMS3Bbin02]|nr:hypothetical protein BMS3Bbin02_01358 [bacterium BMS3Bbin02]